MESFLVILSETTLALYPILIKTVPTEITTQLLWRFITFSIMAFTFATSSDITGTWGSLQNAGKSLGLGALTLSHVGTSYYAFQELSAGSSMSLFYTYPFWIFLGASFLYGESIEIVDIFLLAVAFLGTSLIAYGTQQDEKREDTWKGILSGLAAAFTEAAMYFAVRGADRPNPFYSVLQLYPGALALLVPFLLFQNHIPDTRPNIIASLFSFNSIIGFFGYALRFYLIPRIPTIVFSVLSFFGVLASFLWGALFVNEKPNGVTLSGAALIVLSSAGLTFLKGYT